MPGTCWRPGAYCRMYVCGGGTGLLVVSRSTPTLPSPRSTRSSPDLDHMEPMAGWAGLTTLADELGDEAIVGLMRCSVVRGSESGAQNMCEPACNFDPTPAAVRKSSRA